MTLYEQLGVARDASDAEIRHAYRRAAMKWHPDRAGEEHKAKFQAIQEAYDVLGVPPRRQRYDETGSVSTDTPVRAAALEQLAQLWLQIIDELNTVNFRAALEERIVKAIANLRGQPAELDKRIEIREKILRILRKKDGQPGVLHTALTANIEGLRKQRDGIEKHIAVAQEMLQVLEEYEYGVPPPPAQYNYQQQTGAQGFAQTALDAFKAAAQQQENSAGWRFWR